MLKLRESLMDKNISPSRPRVAILKYLRENFTHPTADEIFRELRDIVPTLSLTTVYNTLKLFSEKGLCQALTINEKQACFDGDITPHGHFFCTECGKVYDIPQSAAESVSPSIETEFGHRVSEIHYYYKGICAHCLKLN